jgi:molybdenum cofactor biosynthesis protein A
MEGNARVCNCKYFKLGTLNYEMSRPTIYDNHGREINYLRLAVTDRCNLRCFYCMPEEGIKYVAREDLLTYEEMLRLIRIVAAMGVNKIRVTGGEPFVRKGMIDFLESVSGVEGIDDLHITTNGTLTDQYIGRLVDMGMKSVNLSLDTLDKQRFFDITRRDEFDKVWSTLHQLIDAGMKTKINAVVMSGRNTQDIVPFVELTRKYPIAVRFIEEMPFNGSDRDGSGLQWNHVRILEEIRRGFPDVEKLPDPPFSTSQNYRVPDFAGSVGIIAAYSRTFCGTCNRLRVTPVGQLKTCLYDGGVFNIRDLMRKGATDTQVADALLEAIGNRAKDGWEAEKSQRFSPITESMSTIGG